MKYFIKSVTMLTGLALGLTSLNYAKATDQTNSASQLNPALLSTLKKLDVKVEKVILKNSTYTIVSTDSGLVTFLGNDGNTIFPGSPFTIDQKTGQIYKLKYKLLIDHLKPFSQNFITVSPKETKYHLYMIDNINCSHCQQALHDYQKFLDAGYSITYVPYVNSPEQALKVSYILNLPADQRFKALLTPPKTMPKAKEINPLIPKVSQVLFNYGVNAYPIFLNNNGVAQEGYHDFKTTEQFYQPAH